LSATQFQIELLHDRSGVKKGWDRQRVYRCCNFLRVTLEELAARSAIPVGQLKKWVRAGRVPPYIALLFFLQEQAELNARYG